MDIRKLSWAIAHLTLGLFAIAVSAAGARALHAQAEGLVIRDVTVISGERAAPLHHAYVRIVGDKIARVSNRPLRGRVEIDGSGRYLIPGLIDSHVHLTGRSGKVQIAGMTDDQIEAHPAMAADARHQAPLSFLYFGFTTILDLRGRSEVIAEWNSRDTRPAAYFCGAAPMLNGYSFISLEDSPYFLFDSAQGARLPFDVSPSDHTPDAVVRRMTSDGAICVKTYYETGFAGARNLPTPTQAMLRELVAAAGDRRLPVFITPIALKLRKLR